MDQRSKGDSSPLSMLATWLRLSFPARLALVMLFVAGLSTVMTTLVITPLVEAAMHESVWEEVRVLQRTSGSLARTYFNLYEDEVRFMAASPRMRDGDARVRRSILDLMRRTRPSFSWLGFFGPDGSLVVASDGTVGGRYRDPSLVSAGMHAPSIGTASRASAQPGGGHVVYAMPISSARGTVEGVLVAEVDPEDLLKAFELGRIRSSGETYLVTGAGTLLGNSRFPQPWSGASHVTSHGFEEALAGRRGIAVYPDYRRVTVIGAYAPFDLSERIAAAPRWALLSEIDYTEATRPVDALNRQRLLIGAFIVMLSSLGIVLAIRRVTLPLLRLRAVADRISQGNWHERVRVDAIDEVGQLGLTFNRMAEHVESYITAQARSEEALSRALSLMRAQQEASLDAILVVDEHGGLVGYNQRTFVMFDLPHDLASTGKDGELQERMMEKAAMGLEATRARVEALIKDRTATTRDEIELVDGRVLDRFTAPVLTSTGEHIGRIFTFRDITERKHLERTLLEQNEQLQQLGQLKNDFINGVSHDLRTPLTSVYGYLEFLDEGVAGPLNEKQRSFVNQIKRGADRVIGMVNDLLDVARWEAGTFQLDLEELDLVAKVKELVDSMGPQLEEARVPLEVSMPPGPLWLVADPDRLARVFTNLLSNALKFTPAGGRIVLRGAVDGAEFVGEVADTGPGIAPEDQPKLFKRFSQLEAGKRRKGGTGLGLSVCKTIVEAHGGRIGVRSEPGKGATFWFRIPLRSPSRAPEHPHEEAN